METKRDFVVAVAETTEQLLAVELDDPNGLFTDTLRQMARDAVRWLDNQWETPERTKTSIERAIEVLGQDLIVLLGHARNAELRHTLLGALVADATMAAKSGFIEDKSHREYFLPLTADPPTESRPADPPE